MCNNMNKTNKTIHSNIMKVMALILFDISMQYKITNNALVCYLKFTLNASKCWYARQMNERKLTSENCLMLYRFNGITTALNQVY